MHNLACTHDFVEHAPKVSGTPAAEDQVAVNRNQTEASIAIGGKAQTGNVADTEFLEQRGLPDTTPMRVAPLASGRLKHVYSNAAGNSG